MTEQSREDDARREEKEVKTEPKAEGQEEQPAPGPEVGRKSAKIPDEPTEERRRHEETHVPYRGARHVLQGRRRTSPTLE